MKKKLQDGQWKLPVLTLRQVAIQKLGVGWQTELAQKTTFTQSNISRMFGLKYPPSLKNLVILAEALGVEINLSDRDNVANIAEAVKIAISELE